MGREIGAAPPTRTRAALLTFFGGSASTIVLAAQSLITIPLALHVLGSRALGGWLASGDVLAWMLALDLGLPQLIAQRVGNAHGAHDARRVHEVFVAGAIMLAALALLTAAGTLLASTLVPRSLGFTGAEGKTLGNCFAAAGLATGLMIASNCVVGYARGVQDTAIVSTSLFVGTVCGAVATIAGLMLGAGMWAFPFGLLARAGITLLGSLLFTIMEFRRRALVFVKPPNAIFREFAALVPASGVGGVCSQMMSQSESVLIGVLLRPELVPVYLITRRGADVLRALVDSVALAVYGGFAHLVGSADRARGLAVHARVTNFRLILSVSAAAGYLVANQSFVTVWAGPAMYGGHLLTILFALQMVATGGSLLMNYLYRATGAILDASIWQIGEACVRVPLAALTIVLAGFTLAPLPGILVSSVTAYLLLRKTQDALSNHAAPVALLSRGVTLGIVATLLAGVAGGAMAAPASWFYVIGAGSSIAVVCALILFRLDPHPLIPRLAFR